MIKVRTLQTGDLIHSIHVSGHADYADHGQDLVCAAVSSIMYGTANALDEMDHFQSSTVQIDDNELVVEMNIYDEKVQTILKTCYYQLATVKKSNKNYIQIRRNQTKKMEV